MRRISFILTIAGIALLLSIMLNSIPKQITSSQDLENLSENQKVFIQGVVTKQTAAVITLDKDIPINCNNCPNYLNKNVSAIAFIDEYNGKKTIHLLSLRVEH